MIRYPTVRVTHSTRYHTNGSLWMCKLCKHTKNKYERWNQQHMRWNHWFSSKFALTLLVISSDDRPIQSTVNCEQNFNAVFIELNTDEFHRYLAIEFTCDNKYDIISVSYPFIKWCDDMKYHAKFHIPTIKSDNQTFHTNVKMISK